MYASDSLNERLYQGDILRERGAMTKDDLGLLGALVARQVKRHGDVQQSLQALEVSSSARRVFTALPDPDVQASLARLATPFGGSDHGPRRLVQGYEGMKQRQDKIPPPFRTDRLKEALERLIALYDGNR